MGLIGHAGMQEDWLSMTPNNAAERAETIGPDPGDPDAIEFVRFCYRRRRVGWPELYDEMCAVAGRGLYRGYDADDLGQIGIGFALYQMPTLAVIVHRVVAEDHERRRLSAETVRTAYVASEATEPAATPTEAAPIKETEVTEQRPRLLAAVGA
jgi:hypothetical protein